MNALRWMWAGAAAAGVLGALGAALWLGGGPGTRDGWEAAGWAAGVVAALALVVAAVLWAARPGRGAEAAEPTAPARPGVEPGGVVNTVTGGNFGTLVQARDIHGPVTAGRGGDRANPGGGTPDGPAAGGKAHRDPEPPST